MLAWSVFVASTVLGVTTPAAAQTNTCDQNGDGVDGFITTVQSDGDDDIADAVAEDLAIIVPISDPGYRYDVDVCSEVDEFGMTELNPISVDSGQVLADEAPIWNAQATAAAVAAVEDILVQPGWDMQPEPNGLQIIGLESWLWITPPEEWWVPKLALSGRNRQRALLLPCREIGQNS